MSQLNVDVINPASASSVTINSNLTVSGTNSIVPYKVYTAWLSQNGLNPEASVLHNTLGATITWSRSSTGNYLATASAPVFTQFKTVVFAQVSGGSGATWPTLIITSRLSNTQVFLNTIRPDSVSTAIDQLPSLTAFEIRVYN